MADDKTKSEDVVPQADKQAHTGDRRARGERGRASPQNQQGRGGEEEGQLASVEHSLGRPPGAEHILSEAPPRWRRPAGRVSLG